MRSVALPGIDKKRPSGVAVGPKIYVHVPTIPTWSMRMSNSSYGKSAGRLSKVNEQYLLMLALALQKTFYMLCR